MVAVTEFEARTKADERNLFVILTSLAEHVDEAVTITRTEENGGVEIIYVNEAFANLTGYQPEEVIGRSPGLLQGPQTDHRTIDDLNNRLAQDLPFHGQTTNYRKNGEPFLMDWEVVTFHNDHGQKQFYMAVQREAE